MADQAGPQARRRRRWPIAVLALGVLVVGAVAFAAWHYTRTDKLTALLVDKTRDLLGADLVLGGTAHFGFVPRLHLILPHPVLKATGAKVAFATADSLETSVPWHTLWSDRYDIERIDLAKPVLDLDALRAWSAAQPPARAVPEVNFVLHVADGTILGGGQPVAQGVNLEFASAGDIAAWFTRIEAQPSTWPLLPPLTGSAAASAVQIGVTRLEGVQVEVRDDTTTDRSKSR